MPRLRREAVLDLYILGLSLFLLVSPWIFRFGTPDARVDIWTVSAAIAVLPSMALLSFAAWEARSNLLLGVWLIVSPWLLGFAHTRAMHFSIGVGAAIAFLAALELWLLREQRERSQVGADTT